MAAVLLLMGTVTMSFHMDKVSTRLQSDVDVEFIPEDNFLGTADGISFVVQITTEEVYDTGWSTKFPDPRTKH